MIFVSVIPLGLDHSQPPGQFWNQLLPPEIASGLFNRLGTIQWSEIVWEKDNLPLSRQSDGSSDPRLFVASQVRLWWNVCYSRYPSWRIGRFLKTNTLEGGMDFWVVCWADHLVWFVLERSSSVIGWGCHYLFPLLTCHLQIQHKVPWLMGKVTQSNLGFE